ncbi:P27 family phage terminase small subunit [Clostridium intestinale]|uniref:P27 family phage terminase small subunit n=1 Tax=Clostridium intestinale TaxID=36845 RepID=A0A7D6ZJT9_9CLOT|nr:P27 family phage terminase small subunit [Clostridium intestinale]QLY82241.1 P27 family phage terminase small subunit [Clostridium intestinale]
MGRNSKSVNLLSKHLTKEEREKREEAENRLKGNADNIEPSQELTENQLMIFNYIKDELHESKILSNLDKYILTKCAIAIDRLQIIEKKINAKPSLMFNKDIKSAKETYDKDFYRCCNELSLSPQSRAKIGNINLKAKDDEEDPVKKALREDDDE